MKPRAEAVALWRTFVPHEYNSDKEKVTLYALLFVWIVLEVGTTFVPQATPPGSMDWIRMLVLYIVGQMHGIERGRMREVPPGPGAGSSEGGSGSGNTDANGGT